MKHNYDDTIISERDATRTERESIYDVEEIQESQILIDLLELPVRSF
jgi:hypothetical protein